MVWLFQFLAEFLAGVLYTCAVINWSVLGFAAEGAGSLAGSSAGGGLATAALSWGMFFLAMGLCEVPTGYFADRYGHKFSTLTGLSALSVALGLMPLASQPAWLAAAAFSAGVALTLISGAKTAWLYSLRKRYAHHLSGEAFLVRLELTRRGALIAAATVGGLLTTTEPAAIWLLAAAFGACAIVIGARLPGRHEHQPQAKPKLPSLLATLRGVKTFKLGRFYGASAVFALGFAVHDILLQPHILALAAKADGERAALARSALGILFGGMHGAAFLAGLGYSRFAAAMESGDQGRDQSHVGIGIALSTVLLAGGFASAIFVTSFWGFAICWCLSYAAMSWFYPLRALAQLSRVPGEQAATFLSLDEATDGVVRAGFALAMAAGLLSLPPGSLWACGAVALVAAAALYRRALRQG